MLLVVAVIALAHVVGGDEMVVVLLVVRSTDTITQRHK